MDKLDVRIVREVMQGDPMQTFFPTRHSITPAFQALGEKLGVSETTVRERFRKLSGFFSGVTLMPNPVLFGERIAGLEVQVSDATSKDEVIEKILLVQGVFQITDYSGPQAGVVFCFPDETTRRRTADLLLRIAECRSGALTELLLPKCDLRPSRLDFQIILSRQEEITRSNRRIAEELGVSARTIKRRYTKLVSTGAILPHFLVNVGGLEGCVYAKLHVDFKGPAYRVDAESAILSALDDHVFFTGRLVDFTIFNMFLPNIPIARTVLTRVRGIDGVQLARIGFVERVLDSPEVFREKVRNRLSVAAAPGHVPFRVRGSSERARRD